MSQAPAWLATLLAAAATVRAEQLSSFLPPDDGSGRASSVLIAFAGAPEQHDDAAALPSVLLIERAASLRTHANQIAFPGGASDPDDADAVATALREAHEEVGLESAHVQIAATLPPIFLPPSRFVVTPVIGWFDTGATRPTVVDVAEVSRVALVPVAELVDPANRFRVIHPSGWQGPAFEVPGLFVWGFTAGLLDRIFAFAGWERDWDDTVFRPLPERMINDPVPTP
jgi:8-oxo-dGTP pyrophosphatase MutT (NUDIX family)